jgi:hypothetical protein
MIAGKDGSCLPPCPPLSLRGGVVGALLATKGACHGCMATNEEDCRPLHRLRRNATTTYRGGSRTWPCHGTARMQAAVVARLPDRRTAAAGCADMGKKSWSQTPAPIAPRSSHHLGRVLSSYFTGFFLARKRRLRYQHAREFCVGKNMHPKIRSCSVIMIQYGLNRIRIN